MELDKLEVYRIARQLSELAWDTYSSLPKEFRFSLGQQFVESVDSIGANIAEGYGRYHYLDSVKFFYNARGSLWEAKHWTDLLYERGLMTREVFEKMSERHGSLALKLNNLIKTTKARANNLK
jgi:four helix bundle protein